MDKLRMTESNLHSFQFCGATTQEKNIHTSFESVDEIPWYVIQIRPTIYLVRSFIPWFDHSNDTSSAELSRGTICLVCSSNS